MGTTITETHRVIADMLQENTGRHFLDSGGAYGRQWERNQSRLAAAEEIGAIPEDIAPEDHAAWMWAQESRAYWGWHGEWVTLSVFHYLAERLTYAPKLDRLFRLWVQMDGTRDQWDEGRRFYNSSETVEDFIGALVDRGVFTLDGEWAGASGYTYNVDNNLSQDVVYTVAQVADVRFGHEDDAHLEDEFERLELSPEDYVIGVSIHNGCDARGGFTDTRWFIVEGGWDGVAGFFDWDGAELWCSGNEVEREIPGQMHLSGEESRDVVCDAAYTIRSGEIIDRDGSYLPKVEDGELWRWDEETDRVVCARCGHTMECDAPYVG